MDLKDIYPGRCSCFSYRSDLRLDADHNMNNLFRALLVVHIVAGTVALVVAPAAMVTTKGGGVASALGSDGFSGRQM